MILRELGRCEARERGLDPDDEVLAWKLAREISPIPLPAEWSSMRIHALTRRGLRSKGDAVSQSDIAFIQAHFKCAACHIGSLSNLPLFNRLDDRHRLTMAYACSACRKGYLFCRNTLLGTAMPLIIHHWDVPPEEGEE